ncbi:hypothetical protein IMG5_054320, partial [Ichthyophthirius multifiliis]
MYTTQLEQLLSFFPEKESIIFAKIDAENLPEISSKYQIQSVPTLLLIDCLKKVKILKLENEPIAQLLETLTNEKEKYEKQYIAEKEHFFSKISQILSNPGLTMFIVGTPTAPQCRFTRQLVDILAEMEVKFQYYDVNTDDDMVIWLKQYSKWPTFPQIFINGGNLVGGLEEVKKLEKEDKLLEKIPGSEWVLDSEKKIKFLLKNYNVLAFINGVPNDSNCEKSKEFIEILNKLNIQFEFFNVDFDIGVSEQLKKNQGLIKFLSYMLKVNLLEDQM